jgi:hypothetical protein
LFDERQNVEEKGAFGGPRLLPAVRAGGEHTIGGRQIRLVRVGEIVRRQNHLLQIVLRLSPRRSLTNFLHCRQQQADENGDDGDDNE